jgi:hypothetical protein
MQVQVERRPGHLGGEMPVRFRFGGREIEIVENVDQWYGPDYCYFKMQGNDGNLYILRFDEGRVEWDLTMFQSTSRFRSRCCPPAACAHRPCDASMVLRGRPIPPETLRPIMRRAARERSKARGATPCLCPFTKAGWIASRARRQA